MFSGKCSLPKNWGEVLQTDQAYILSGFGITLQCNAGYKLNPKIAADGGRVRCLTNGQWNVDLKSDMCIPDKKQGSTGTYQK